MSRSSAAEIDIKFEKNTYNGDLKKASLTYLRDKILGAEDGTEFIIINKFCYLKENNHAGINFYLHSSVYSLEGELQHSSCSTSDPGSPCFRINCKDSHDLWKEACDAGLIGEDAMAII